MSQKIFWMVRMIQTKTNHSATKGNKEEAILGAIINKQVLYYTQPIYSHSQNRIVGKEILTRLLIDGKVIPPCDFLWIFKLNNLPAFCLSLIDIAFEFSQSEPDIFFTINVTEKELKLGGMDYLIDKASQNPEIAQKIYIELFEETFYDSYIKFAIEELKKVGYKIALDDFGSGNSRIEQMIDSKHGIDMIKIDGVFMRGIEESVKKQKALCSIKEFLNIFTGMIVVEYVATEEAQNIVLRCGYDFMQGYYIGVPSLETRGIQR